MMSMEDAILRLARAVETNEVNYAVLDVIRERDKLKQDLGSKIGTISNLEYRNEVLFEQRGKLERSNAALRGVITRMRKKATK